MTRAPEWLRTHVRHAVLWQGHGAQRIAAETGYPISAIAPLVEEAIAGNMEFLRAEVAHQATLAIEESRDRMRALACRLCELPDAQSPAIACSLATVDEALVALGLVIADAVRPPATQRSIPDTIGAADLGQAAAAIAQPTPTHAPEHPTVPHHPPVTGPSQGVGGGAGPVHPHPG